MKEPEVVEDVNYKCPIGESNHVVMECSLRVEGKIQKNECHRIKRFNYGRTDWKIEELL